MYFQTEEAVGVIPEGHMASLERSYICCALGFGFLALLKVSNLGGRM